MLINKQINEYRQIKNYVRVLILFRCQTSKKNLMKVSLKKAHTHVRTNLRTYPYSSSGRTSLDRVTVPLTAINLEIKKEMKMNKEID